MLTETDASVSAAAEALGELLREHKGQNVSVLDLREMITWTDFFVIATVSSNTHMDGLERHIKDFCYENDISILGKSQKNETGDDEWRLLDLGQIVIHLMSGSARDFYELEKLWTKIPVPHRTPEQYAHSSKSS
ncbi:MAG: ribosome silencing factor [Treponema sp.]|nr:ribosome silencing factor [Treponema sp.]